MTSPSISASSRRKVPRQERSRATVAAIVEAAARVLETRGYERMTTNHVARAAGVSVGSLYQYFSNKDELVRALLERHLREAAELRPAILGDGTALGLRERVRLTVRWWLDAHAARPALHLVLTGLASRVMEEAALRAWRELGLVAIRRALEPYRDELRPGDLDLTVFLYAQCLEAMTHGLVLERPERLADSELLDELTDVLVGLLRGPDPSASA